MQFDDVSRDTAGFAEAEIRSIKGAAIGVKCDDAWQTCHLIRLGDAASGKVSLAIPSVKPLQSRRT